MNNEIVSNELGWFYPWLRQLSHRMMLSENQAITLQPTALANEVIAKMLSWKGELTEEREQSLKNLAATIAKQTLVDRGRRRKRWKDFIQQQPKQENHIPEQDQRNERIQDAIGQLSEYDPLLGKLVRLRFFEDLSLTDAINAVGFSQRTGARKWAFAKAYLADALRE